MEYVLYNGKCFAVITETGKVLKSDSMEKAYRFDTPTQARRKRKQAPAKLEHYHVYTVNGDGKLIKVSHGKTQRKVYSVDVRKMIYEKAHGRCELCGARITYNSMTLDHVIPLAMGGADEVENLSCACLPCNQFKGSILPESFLEKINSICMYQLGKRIGENTIRWKIVMKLIGYGHNY